MHTPGAERAQHVFAQRPVGAVLADTQVTHAVDLEVPGIFGAVFDGLVLGDLDHGVGHTVEAGFRSVTLTRDSRSSLIRLVLKVLLISANRFLISL